MSKNNEILYSSICAGYSYIELDSPVISFYYRHPSFAELFELERGIQTIHNQAVEAGLLSFNDALKLIMEEGWWTQEQEAELNQQTAFLKRLNQTRSIMGTQAERRQVDEQIYPVQKRIAELLLERQKFIPQTAENYANTKINELHINKFLFKDAEFSQPLFSDEDIDNLEKDDFLLIQAKYLEVLDELSYQNIEKLASSVMFQNFLYVSGDNINSFFGLPAAKVSRYQFELFSAGQNFRTIIKNCVTMEREMPEELFGKPDDMNKHYEMVKGAWESKHNINSQRTSGKNNSSMGVSRIGATPEENKIMFGGEANNGGLLAAAKRNGGKLDGSKVMAQRGG